MKTVLSLFLSILLVFALTACSSSPTSPDNANEDAATDPSKEQLVEGKIHDGTMNTLTIETDTGETLVFSTLDADKSQCNGLTIGTTARVYYTGVLSGSDTSGVTVTRVEQDPTEPVTCTLYIGRGETFEKYPQTFASAPTPDQLIQAIASQTGWNLTLAEPVQLGKGGATVVFGAESAIFIGPPAVQQDEFHVYDTEDLVFHILDSVQKTLQMNTVDTDLGDPAQLDVYFVGEGDQPISLPDAGITIPMEEPYPGSTQLQ